MSAEDALKLAADYGVALRLNPTGDGVVFKADEPPPPAVLAALKAAKPEIVLALRRQAVVQWVNERFAASPPNLCAAGCGRPNLPLVPLTIVCVGDREAWFHPHCYRSWLERRCEEAARELGEEWTRADTRAARRIGRKG